MNSVIRMRLWISAAIIALIVVVTFAFSVPHTRDMEVKKTPVPVANVPVVTLHDAFKKGLHTISGSLTVPNACTSALASTTLMGSASTTQSILLTITLESDPGVCLQVPTDVQFQTTLSAPASLPIEARVDDVLASTTSS